MIWARRSQDACIELLRSFFESCFRLSAAFMMHDVRFMSKPLAARRPSLNLEHTHVNASRHNHVNGCRVRHVLASFKLDRTGLGIIGTRRTRT